MLEEFDVVVVGGGVAGVASALACAREHKKVALIEKQCVLGGLATSGLIAIYLPICDGAGHQVSYGISEEFLRLSIKIGCQRKYPKAWLENGDFEDKKKVRFEAQYNPNYFALMLEKILLDNGVIIYYDAFLSDVKKDDNCLKTIVVETLEGKKEIKAKAFVDASGDAKLAYLAKEKTRNYAKGNIVAGWYYYIDEQKLILNKLGVVEESDTVVNERKSEKPLTSSRFLGGVYDDENAFLLESHGVTLKDINKKKEQNNNFEAVMIPMMPEMRMTRCIDGDTPTLDDEHIRHNDSVGVIADWRRRAYVYEVPFRTLKTKTKNLFVAGRCINVNDDMWDITRAIPCCVVTGEASGVAASIYCENESVEIDILQKRLKSKGQRLFIDDVLKNDSSRALNLYTQSTKLH